MLPNSTLLGLWVTESEYFLNSTSSHWRLFSAMVTELTDYINTTKKQPIWYLHILQNHGHILQHQPIIYVTYQRTTFSKTLRHMMKTLNDWNSIRQLHNRQVHTNINILRDCLLSHRSPQWEAALSIGVVHLFIRSPVRVSPKSIQTPYK